MKYVFYNPKANNNSKEEAAKKLQAIIGESQLVDATNISYKEALAKYEENDEIYLVGGDGTLNYFINDLGDTEVKQSIYFYPAGTGNDFLRDVANAADENGLVKINDFIKNLPTVFVKNIEKKFINGIGFGLDGMCCQIGDELKEKSDKKINYTSIAIKLLLFSYKTRNAKVIVDGKEYSFKDVWILPTMKGRYYGGGLMVAPEQDRCDAEGKVTVVVYNGRSRLKSLMCFPKLSSGKLKSVKMLTMLTGKDIYVEYDEPTALQIDGETVRDVKSYTVKA